MIISFILMTLKFDLGVITYGEIRRWLQIIFSEISTTKPHLYVLS